MTAKPIVAATDGSEESLRAVEWAAREAVLHGAPLRIVLAASLPRTASLQLKPERNVVLDMAKIEGEILIGRPVEKVFDFVADSRNEPSFNPAMASVELLTPLPIGLGTRFRARMGRAGTQMLVELTEFDRPHRLGSRTTSSMMETSGALTFAAEGDGTVMGWDWQVRPKGWMRMLGPLFGPLGGRMERRIWTEMKQQLETNGPARSA